MLENLKTYVAERSKAFAAGLSGALATAILHHAEVSFGFDMDVELEGIIVSGVVGLITGVATYWSPPNKPMRNRK